MESYLIFGVGCLLSVIGFLIVFVLNGIKSEIKEIKGQLSKIEGDLHSRITENDRRHQDQYVAIDRRLATVEARCSMVHQK